MAVVVSRCLGCLDSAVLSFSQGSVAIAGAVVRWLRDNMGIVQSSSEIGTQRPWSEFQMYLNFTAVL